jgi:hypothetical protein
MVPPIENNCIYIELWKIFRNKLSLSLAFTLSAGRVRRSRPISDGTGFRIKVQIDGLNHPKPCKPKPCTGFRIKVQRLMVYLSTPANE